MKARESRVWWAVLGLAGVATWVGVAPRPSPGAPARMRAPGIVLLVIDTLRADAVPLPDAGPTRLPSLRAFMTGATSFPDAMAAGAWTAQSMPSLLTGLSPPHTGCQGTGERGVPALPGAVFTLAERLKAVGYDTTAHTGGGHVSASEGIAQGFDVFLPDFDESGPEACVAHWSQVRRAGAPFFLLLHTYVAHDPYGRKRARSPASSPPPGSLPSPMIHRVLGSRGEGHDLAAALREPGVLRECVYEWFFDAAARPANLALSRRIPSLTLDGAMRQWVDGGYLAEPEGRAEIEGRFREAYQRGLATTEEVLSRTFAALEAAKLPPDTIVVVTSDHGEAHGEHGFLAHERRLYDEIVRVPLLIRAPGRMPAGAVVRGTCGLADVAPTLLACAGTPAFEGEFDGRSLLPLATGRAGGHPVLSTADRREADGARVRNVRELAVRDTLRRWTCTYDLDDGTVLAEHVFDLVKDPASLDPHPVGAVVADDPEYCRLVTACREIPRRQAGLPPTESPGGLAR